jgi:hypothetical protein
MMCACTKPLAVLTAALHALSLAAASSPAPTTTLILPGQVCFVIDLRDGHLASGRVAGQTLLSDCRDEYWLEKEDGQPIARTTEAADRVTKVRRGPSSAEVECYNEALHLTVTKLYAPASVPGGLRKTVVVHPSGRRGLLHIFSRVRLAKPFASAAWVYTPRQSWGGRTLLFGVRPLAEIKAPCTSSSGWDNRFVVAFRPERTWAVAHWRAEVDGLWVPATGVIAEWGKESSAALTYLPDGWRWRLLHCLDGQRSRAAADYVLLRGDWYEAWQLYRRLPEYRAAYAYLDTLPAWCRQVKYGTFWQAPFYRDFARTVGALCGRLGEEAYLTIGVFGWSLDGDYETACPFLTEGLDLVLTPQYLRAAVAALQQNPRAKVGLYIQGGLIDSESQCYHDHPDWVIRAPDGTPIHSGFQDNPVGTLYIANPLVTEWVRHHLSRVQAVCRTYNCGFIYLDGGGYCETVDWARRQHITFADAGRLNERVFQAVRATGPQRALLINSQNAPFADLSWLECGYFGPQVPWRETVDFCFDTECQSDPRYTLEPLYWWDQDRYLAMCIAFGFTPCGPPSADMPAATWRAIEAAWQMKPAQLVYSSAATAPVWWRDGVPVVTFAERRGDEVVVPILNFGAQERVRVAVDLSVVGLPTSRPVRATVYQPLLTSERVVVQPTDTHAGRLTFDLAVPSSWRGITLLTLRPQA